MTFFTEPTGYERGLLSDLQGAWMVFRDTVVKHNGFPQSDKVLFHIDEAMSWEAVRDLDRMQKALLLIQNLSLHGAPDSVQEELTAVRELMDETLQAIRDGEVL
ncbi:MAG: hypothetical protein HQL48_04260 [Gammaproteobacteria bacterium]|nr:hypothetical protein [Gammaproteobacteria bacterium]